MLKDRLRGMLNGDPLTREEIVLRTGGKDREVRQAIRDLRLEGLRIVTDMNGGYFIAKTDQEYLVFRRAMVSRVAKIMQVARAMDGRLEGQECFGVTNAEQ